MVLYAIPSFFPEAEHILLEFIRPPALTSWKREDVMLKKDNRGFTLVELIISLTIFAIVVTAALGFMVAGARTYGSVTGRLNLDLEAQLAMSQLNDYIIDCNACLYYSNDRLFVVNKNSNGTYTAYLYEYRSNHRIYFGTGTATYNSITKNFDCTVTASDLLAKDVTSFSVLPISSDTINVTSAVVTINFSNKYSSYNGKKTIALRNRTAIATAS